MPEASAASLGSGPGRDPDPVPPPWRVEARPVGDGHVLHVEHWGTPVGLPALVLHGGPGSGGSPVLRRGFDPKRWHVVMPDQRGAGRSTPVGHREGNTTAALVDDLLALQDAHGLRGWLVVGGSWGATLALALAAAAPHRVSGLLLRNPFLARASDLQRFFAPHAGTPAGLVGALHEAAGVAATAPVPSLLRGLNAALDDAQAPSAARAALAWWRWEADRSGVDAASLAEPAAERLPALIARYRVQSHYLVHDCWLPEDGALALAARLPASLPVHVVQGGADEVCPPDGARALRAALPGSTGIEVPGAGHDPTHPGLAAAIGEALACWAAQRRWPGAPGHPAEVAR